MARIALFTYVTRIDRRALLQCKTLIEHGHDVTLYASPFVDEIPDPYFVKRLDKLENPDGSSAPKKPPKTSYQLALDTKRWLAERYPQTLQWLLPIARSAFWRIYQMFPRTQEDVFLKMFQGALAIDQKADMYIAHDLPMLPVAVEAKRRYGGKVLYDSHELFPDQEFSASESRMWRKMERTYIGNADVVVTINPSIAREMERHYGLPKVEVVYNAGWIPEGEPAQGCIFHEILSLPPKARILLYQGGLSFERNLPTLVQAMVHVADPMIHLVFLGDGPARDGLMEQISTLGLTARVHMLKAVPQEKLAGYTSSADLGVIPYQNTCLNNYYCTPSKLFEFIAAALPIIATDLPEIARIVTTHQIGLVGDTSRPESLAAMVTQAMAPDELARFRANLLRAREVINWQQEGKYFAGIVSRTLANN